MLSPRSGFTRHEDDLPLMPSLNFTLRVTNGARPDRWPPAAHAETPCHVVSSSWRAAQFLSADDSFLILSHRAADSRYLGSCSGIHSLRNYCLSASDLWVVQRTNYGCTSQASVSVGYAHRVVVGLLCPPFPRPILESRQHIVSENRPRVSSALHITPLPCIRIVLITQRFRIKCDGCTFSCLRLFNDAVSVA
jgi:hypothetical protein